MDSVMDFATYPAVNLVSSGFLLPKGRWLAHSFIAAIDLTTGSGTSLGLKDRSNISNTCEADGMGFNYSCHV